MSEAEEIEEAAGRVIDKLEIELGQLQARVAELEHGDETLVQLLDERDHNLFDLETKTKQCETWKLAAVLLEAVILMDQGPYRDEMLGRALEAQDKARALEAKLETEIGKS